MAMRSLAAGSRAVLALLLFFPASILAVNPTDQASTAGAQLDSRLRHISDLMSARSFAEAETAAAKLESEFPRSAAVEQAYAAALDSQGKLEAAGTHWQRALELEPRSAAAHLNVGSNYFRRGMKEAARKQFESATVLDPTDARALYNLGLADFALENFPAALSDFHRAHQIDPASVETSYYLSMSYLIAGRPNQALTLVNSLSTQAQQRPEFLIIKVAAESKSGTDVEQDFQHVLATLGDAPKPYASAAALFMTIGDTAHAVRVMEAANSRFPGQTQIEYLLALAYSRNGQLQTALGTLKSALVRDDNAALHALYGKLLEQHGDSVEAEHELQRAAQLDPSEANINALGIELLNHWTFDAAISVFQSGMQAHPDSQMLRVGLAIANFAAGNYDETVKTIITAGQHPELIDDNAMSVLMAAYPNSHANSAQVRAFAAAYARRHPESAWASYYAAMAVIADPSHSASAADKQEAIRLLEHAASLDGNVAQFRYQLGVARSDAGDWTAALTALRSAVKLDDTMAEAWYRLALAAKRTGNARESEEAIARYTAANERANSKLQERMAQTKKFVSELPK